MQHPRIVSRRCSAQISAGILYILIEVFRGFPQSSRANSRTVPQSGHNHFLTNPCQFTYHHTIWYYVFWIWKSMLNNPQKERRMICSRLYIFSPSCNFLLYYFILIFLCQYTIIAQGLLSSIGKISYSLVSRSMTSR
jgi:hypothetical protein